MEKDIHSQTALREPARSDTAVNALARAGLYTVIGLTGIRLGITKIWDMFYDNFKSYPEFDELRADRRTKLLAVKDEAAANPSLTRSDVAKKIRTVENDYGHEFNNIIKKSFKIESEGFWGFIKGTKHRFDTLGGYTQAKIGFATVFSTVAAVGGILLIERMATGHKLRQLHDDVQAQSERSRA